MPFENGPYLKSAVFCEKVLRETDNVMSIIRIVDRVTITAQGPDTPDTMPQTPYPINAVVTLVSGSARGRHEIKIVREGPSGITQEAPFKASIQMEGEDRSANVVINIQLNLDAEGLHWFYVYFDDVLLTKMPFRAMYNRLSTGAAKMPRS